MLLVIIPVSYLAIETVSMIYGTTPSPVKPAITRKVSLVHHRRDHRQSEKRRAEKEIEKAERALAAKERRREAIKRNQGMVRLRKYGLTSDRYDEILASQGGVCICGQEARAIDHDHQCCDRSGSCGECVRGILCSRCNLILGYAKDDPDVLTRLARYLT